jgi:hypothetical protein
MASFSASMHLALARERQADLIREARRAELARLVPRDEREGHLIARIARLLKRGRQRPPVPATR